jgi:spore coat protein U-like protein
VRIFFPPPYRLAAAAAALCAAAPAGAQATETLRIAAAVPRSCNVVALPMMFGAIATRNPRADAQASVIVSCTPGVAFTVTMNDGLHPLGTQRRMENPNVNGAREYLTYEIYRDPGRSQRWGGTAATGVSRVATAAREMVLTAYGRLDARRAAASAYTDVVTVAVSF